MAKPSEACDLSTSQDPSEKNELKWRLTCFPFTKNKQHQPRKKCVTLFFLEETCPKRRSKTFQNYPNSIEQTIQQNLQLVVFFPCLTVRLCGAGRVAPCRHICLVPMAHLGQKTCSATGFPICKIQTSMDHIVQISKDCNMVLLNNLVIFFYIKSHKSDQKKQKKGSNLGSQTLGRGISWRTPRLGPSFFSTPLQNSEAEMGTVTSKLTPNHHTLFNHGDRENTKKSDNSTPRWWM